MTINQPAAFGAWLTDRLEERGITSGVAAARLFGGVSHSSVGSWKRGAASPSLDNFQAIAEGLGMPLWQVLVAAGWISAPTEWKPLELADVSTRALLEELERRTHR